MFDSDEDEFQAQTNVIRTQRMLHKKQKAPVTAPSRKRTFSSSTPSSSAGSLDAEKRRKPKQIICDPGSGSHKSHHQRTPVPSIPSAAEIHQPPQPNNHTARHAVAEADHIHNATHATVPVQPADTPHVCDDVLPGVTAVVPGPQHTESAGSPALKVAEDVSPRVQRLTVPDGTAEEHGRKLQASLTLALASQQACTDVCPVCGVCLGNIALTEVGKAAHINSCLDAAVQQPCVAQAAVASAEAPQQQVVIVDHEDEDEDIAGWLAGIGASVVLDQFIAADVDLSVLPHLNDGDLQEMAIDDASLRQKILAAVASTQQTVGQAAPLDHASSQEEQQLTHVEIFSQAITDTDTPGWDVDADCVYDEWDGGGQDENLLPLQADSQQQHSIAMTATAAAGVMTAVSTAPAGGYQLWQQRGQQGCCHQQVRAALQPVQQSRANLMHKQQQQQSIGCQQQSSITGWLQRQQQSDNGRQGLLRGEHQQASSSTTTSAKQQWQALFSKPGRVLAPPQPLMPHFGTAQQRQLGHHGELVARSSRYQQLQEQGVQQQLGLPAQPSGCLIMSRGRTADLPRWWPAWRRLPGTNIVVDCFGQSSKSIGSNRSWILTHFHADHYMGLSKGFKQGKIICTRTTAALVKLKLRVPEQLLVPLDLGQDILVEGTRVQLIDANHCPGAAMVVAHPPGGLPPVLHTGDARLTAAATQQQPALQALVGKAVLVLDTTYADPAYCFPPQQEVLDWVLRAVKAESFNPRTLFLFGSYTIGKERLFLHVASALKAKVYVAAAKRAVMGAINLPPEQAALLTTNHLEANIHVVPMRQVNLSEMESLLVRYKGRYTAVVGFQPTGWTQGGGSGGAGQPSRSTSSVRPNKRVQRGTVVMYKVPYSEHSSCAELREFVRWFKPINLIPSVSNDNGPKLKQMLAAVTNSGKVTGPLDGWAQRSQQQQQ